MEKNELKKTLTFFLKIARKKPTISHYIDFYAMDWLSIRISDHPHDPARGNCDLYFSPNEAKINIIWPFIKEFIDLQFLKQSNDECAYTDIDDFIENECRF